MQFNEYQYISKKTIPADIDKRDALANFSMGLTGEAGEAIELVKKALFHGKTLDLSELEKELGDVLWYLSALCSIAGISLDTVAKRNVEKLAKRYPNGFNFADVDNNR